MSVKNLVQCPLITPVSSTATELLLGAVSAPYSLPPLDGGILVISDSPSKPSFVEFITYTHRIDNVLYGVSRGQEETAARAWSGVTYVYQALTADQYTSELASKEPVIPPGTTAQYWRGDKTFQDLSTAIRAANLTGFSTATNAAVVSTDTLLAALGKLQAQMNVRLLSTANAVSASKLQTARTISVAGDATGSLTFDGTANVSMDVSLQPSGVSAGTFTKVTVDSKGRVTAGTSLVAADIPTLNQSTTGNAGSATKLQTARTINGTAFDGTANITVADATKLPLSGGKMTGALAHQFLAGAAGVTTYRNLAVYTNSAATVTGTMKITLPFGWTSTMMSLKLKGFNYNVVGAWELSLGGYNYGSGSWVNTSASTMGTSVPFSSVRFAFDGTNACILLGNTASTWNYPKVIIEEMLAGFSNVELDWGNGWSITVIQDETGLSAFNEPVLNANTNALLLNGRDSAYYLDAGNLVGTVPSARLSGTYGISISGNAATATTATNATNAASAAKLATARTISITGDVTGSATFDGSANISINAQLPDYTAWNSSSAKDGVVGMLGWRHYGNSHVIFDASASTAPNGVAKSNTNPDNAWTPQYPTLMGWNGTSTYGVRVDRARYAESLTSNITINGVAANVGSNITIADSTKLPLAGGSLSGALKVVVNTAGSNYGDGQLELRNSDAGHVSMGFHRGGYTACQLRHSGNGLILSGTGQTTAADLYVYGNVTAYSDERLKTDIETIPEALAKVEQMNGVTFAKTNEEEARRHTGVIAQEVLAVLPEAVHMGDDGFYSVAYGNLAGLFIQAIKELNAKVDALTAEVEMLQGSQQ